MVGLYIVIRFFVKLTDIEYQIVSIVFILTKC